MKTPQNWLESVDFDWDEQVSVRMIEAIQQDAFESGWKRGMEDAMDMQSKGVDPNRAIDAWKPTWCDDCQSYHPRHNGCPPTPNPLKSPSI